MIDYHEERMSTVNKIMRKLWKHVYQGTDTTSIEISTEATDGVGANRRSYNYKLIQTKHGCKMDMKGRCSAGQRVIKREKKNDSIVRAMKRIPPCDFPFLFDLAILPVQVLASIIIRLALAETFCKDCGILALDEPTTNLDEENAKSLADMLTKCVLIFIGESIADNCSLRCDNCATCAYVNRVVELRSRHQKNFQLIIISHDEKFLQKLADLNNYKVFYELYRKQKYV